MKAPAGLFLAAALACAGPAGAGEIVAQVTDQRGAPVSDAVVVAVPDAGLPAAPARPPMEIVDQVDREFVPEVKAILAGSLVTFPNKDNIRHQVYSFSKAKTFELPLYAGTPATPVLFDKPGVVVLGCNIHDWMVGYIYVSESPYFAKTGADGKAVLGLPGGAYSVRVWHPLMGGAEDATRRGASVGAAPLALQWSIGLKPEIRVRRAPADDAGGPY